ncbi:MAG: tRNA lysidine(34) synthetase TilS [Bacteroidales bacterium]|nr:tRNA lysidine(34) synthetase TilS [Bacteroidales bacterium]
MIVRFQQQMTRLTGNPAAYRYLLAVSGGADSMVMADLFLETGYDFAIAHCNFHLRGEDSNRDMRFVQQWAEGHHVVCYVQEFNTLGEKEQTGESVEMAARRLRYEWFEEVGQDYDYIVTAHHANDDAETILLNMVRGTGLKGLTGIPAINGHIIRPLLTFSSEEIHAYATDHHLDFVTDCTNADERIKRNKIRHSVLPTLQTLNPNLIQTMTHNKEIWQQQYALYQCAVQELKKKAVSEYDDGIAIKRSIIDGHPYSEVLLYEILRPLHFSEADVKAMLQAQQTGKIFLAPEHTLVVNRDEYLVFPTLPPSDEPLVLHNLDELRSLFNVTQTANNGDITSIKRKDALFIAPDKLTFPVTVRHWQHGDYFYPLGGKGKRKLSDFFNDQKISRLEKQRMLLFCIGEDIAWVVGHRSDERFKVLPTDTEYLIITTPTNPQPTTNNC